MTDDVINIYVDLYMVVIKKLSYNYFLAFVQYNFYFLFRRRVASLGHDLVNCYLMVHRK